MIALSGCWFGRLEMKRLVLVSFIGWGWPALAEDSAQAAQRVGQNFGLILSIVRTCGGEMNRGALIAAQVAQSNNKASFAKGATAATIEWEQSIAGLPKTAVCEMAATLYGPTGLRAQVWAPPPKSR